MTRALLEQALSLSGYYESTWVGDLGDLEKLVQVAIEAIRAQQAERHAEELLAYEVTADNLKQDRDTWAARCASEVAKAANLDHRLKRDAKRHAEELLAYEVTVGNLRAQPEQCWCDEQGIGKPGVSCGDCPTRDYKEQS